MNVGETSEKSSLPSGHRRYLEFLNRGFPISVERRGNICTDFLDGSPQNYILHVPYVSWQLEPLPSNTESTLHPKSPLPKCPLMCIIPPHLLPPDIPNQGFPNHDPIPQHEISRFHILPTPLGSRSINSTYRIRPRYPVTDFSIEGFLTVFKYQGNIYTH